MPVTRFPLFNRNAGSGHQATEAGRRKPGCLTYPGGVYIFHRILNQRWNVQHTERKAVAVDPDAKERNLKRLRRIEGQVRGLQKMVEDDRYCADIMTQISSVNEALRAVGRELMKNHLRHCATKAIRSSEVEAGEMYDEIVDLMYKAGR